ncbi:hypothetical protein K431DRAFT_321496 [Polychaeton citri CBS 116435]|uniref:SPRY domain-containing protein n=1 Tax=Polychaeton citri CBS 116435 TaxID=1314669 RepID=A0A9P4Q4Q1_9PEZI|nr:hypothetical protein K431DRAFT_321496 [Polychaeton citri CBS 116435]
MAEPSDAIPAVSSLAAQAAPLLEPHLPANPSPLNPASRAPSRTPAPVQREQREKKESLKKRESNITNGSTVSSLGKRKANAQIAYPSPQRFNVPPPKPSDFDHPRPDILTPHEPFPFLMPDGETQLMKPADLAENKRGYRYTRAIADPLFPHKQFYRCTSPPPHHAKFSFEDADRWMHFTDNALVATNEKGWRMCRANVCAREGTMYYEIKVHRGVPFEGPVAEANGPQPHVRFGWARREAPLDAPVGFDGYSYGITDLRFETMHRSRPGKLYHAKPAKGKGSKGAKSTATAITPSTVTLAPEDQNIKEGDVIGVELQLPSLSLHQKIVTGVYNPAVDNGDGFGGRSSKEPKDPHGTDVLDVIRDRIPVSYKGNTYFETLDHVASKPMESYADRTLNIAANNSIPSAASKETVRSMPNPNHEHVSLRTLPHSAVRIYRNGALVGTAFENLLAFLPPASGPSKTMGAREGFDDGMIGYFPAVACFWGGIAEVNFGDGKNGFWSPPQHIRKLKSGQGQDVRMSDAEDTNRSELAWAPGNQLRAVGERYCEQIAEDIVWDMVDEVDFFVQDGAYEGTAGQGATSANQRIKIED